MRQLNLAETKQSYLDWAYEQAEEWGIDLRNDPHRDATLKRLAACTPEQFRDPAAAEEAWLLEKLRRDLKADGVRAVGPVVLMQEGKESSDVEGKHWQQLTLSGYQEWEAQNAVHKLECEAKIAERATENCALHPEWLTTPQEVLRGIYRLARQRRKQQP